MNISIKPWRGISIKLKYKGVIKPKVSNGQGTFVQRDFAVSVNERTTLKYFEWRTNKQCIMTSHAIQNIITS